MSTDPNGTVAGQSVPRSSTTERSFGRRVRWRVIPVTLLYLYGGGLVMDGLIYLGVIYGLSITAIWRDLNEPDAKIAGLYILLVGHAAIAVGCLFLFAGRSLWCAHWWRGIIGTLLAAALCGAVGVVVQFVGAR